MARKAQITYASIRALAKSMAVEDCRPHFVVLRSKELVAHEQCAQ